MSNLTDQSEMLTTVGVSKDIICKDCKHRGNKYNDYTRVMCEEYPDRKPMKILFEGFKCHFYEKE